jgi:cytochrome c biogenesis protein CcdA
METRTALQEPSVGELLLKIKDDALEAAKAELALLEAEAGMRTDALRRAAITSIAGLVFGLAAVVALSGALVLWVGDLIGHNWPLAALIVAGGLGLVAGVLVAVTSRGIKKALSRPRAEGDVDA